jgi:hypothetical protein
MIIDISSVMEFTEDGDITQACYEAAETHRLLKVIAMVRPSYVLIAEQCSLPNAHLG